MSYSVKQFAEMFGTTEHTVRYYTDIGLLPCSRDSANRRVFDDNSANWMQGIICLKGCGASMDEIKEYCRLCNAEESEENLTARYNIILSQRQKALERLKEAEAAVDFVNSKIAHYQEILAGAIPDDSNPDKWSETLRPKKHE